MNAKRDKFFQMCVDQQFLERLDNLRRGEPDLPSRTEMALRLIESAFALLEAQLHSRGETRSLPQVAAVPLLEKLRSLAARNRAVAPRRVVERRSRQRRRAP